MKYTFNKDFGFFKANDELCWDESINAFTLDVKEDNGFRSAMIDKNTVEELHKEGIISMRKEASKIDLAIKFINDLLSQYEKDYEDMIEKYNDGKVQPCVKVEAETVYFNLTKVLNKIKDILKDE